MRILLSSLIYASPLLVAGFIFPEPMHVKPGLTQLIDSHPGVKLKIKLDIGKEADQSHLGINGMVFHLHTDTADSDSVKMPGE
jgi:hypothetical protein